MSVNDKMQPHVEEILERIREPMGLDRWRITIKVGPCRDEEQNERCRGSTHADPEYSQATINMDVEALETGEDVEEYVVHEATHIPAWWLHQAAEDAANAWADSAPKPLRNAIRKYAREQVRRAAEKSVTDLGHAFLRLFRRLWAAEAEIKQLKGELKATRKQAVPPEK